MSGDRNRTAEESVEYNAAHIFYVIGHRDISR